MPTHEDDPYRLTLPEGAAPIDLTAPGGVVPTIGAVATGNKPTITHTGNLAPGAGQERPDLGPDGTVRDLMPGEVAETNAPEDLRHLHAVAPRIADDTKTAYGLKPSAVPDSPREIAGKPQRSKAPLYVGAGLVGALVVGGGAYALGKNGGEAPSSATPVSPDKSNVSTANIPPTGDTIANGSIQVSATGEQGTGSANSQTSAPATSTAEGSATVKPGEAIVNPDGTVLLPVEAFRGNPDALAKAFITQSRAAWVKAGATAEMVDAAYDKVPAEGKSALTSAAHTTAQANMQRLADNTFATGWEDKTDLVGAANVLAKSNEAYLLNYIKTANPRNTPGMATDLNPYDNMPHFDETSTVEKDTLLLGQGDDMTIRIVYNVENNAPETSIAKEVPTTSEGPTDETFTFTPEIDDETEILVFKLSKISSNQ